MIDWFFRDPDHGLPALARLPEGGLRVALGGDEVVATWRALWVPVGARWARIAAPGPWTVCVPADGEVVAWTAGGVGAILRADTLSVDADPRRRAGLDLTVWRDPGGPWTVQGGPVLPHGARYARDFRPWPAGRGLCWSSDGFAYRWPLDGRVEAFATGAAWHYGVDGRPVRGPAPPPPDPVPQQRPDAFVAARADVGALRLAGTRPAGDRVEGWARDGTRVYVSSDSLYS